MKHTFYLVIVLTLLLMPIVTMAAFIVPCTTSGNCSNAGVFYGPSPSQIPSQNQATKTTPVIQNNTDVLLGRILALENKVIRLEKLLNILGNVLGIKNLNSLVK